MARNGTWNLLKELDRVAATTIYNGPKRAAERIVRELQERGPAWTGKFSNSWQIETPTTVKRGTGAPGNPVPIVTPPLTGIQVTTSIGSKDKVVFRISNFSSYADIATDVEPGVFINPGTEPIKPIDKVGKRQKGIRGLLTGSGGNRRTAPLDWFSIYVKGGAIDKTIEIAMRTTDR
jgi:hypothetical protein